MSEDNVEQEGRGGAKKCNTRYPNSPGRTPIHMHGGWCDAHVVQAWSSKGRVTATNCAVKLAWCIWLVGSLSFAAPNLLGSLRDSPCAPWAQKRS